MHTKLVFVFRGLILRNSYAIIVFLFVPSRVFFLFSLLFFLSFFLHPIVICAGHAHWFHNTVGEFQNNNSNPSEAHFNLHRSFGRACVLMTSVNGKVEFMILCTKKTSLIPYTKTVSMHRPRYVFWIFLIW